MSLTRVDPSIIQPPKAYLISYDNGQSYEDHHREPLFLVPSHEEAQRIISVSKAWIDVARDQAPEKPETIYGEEGYYEALSKHQDAMRAYVARLVTPFGIEELRRTVELYGDDCGSLIMTELDYWTPAFSSAIPSVPTPS